MKSYSELIKLPTFEERLRYLQSHTRVGELKFGHARFLNQAFYKSTEWRQCRRKVIARDNGCDMGLEDYPIYGRIIVHHINDLTVEDFERGSSKLFDLENLICVSNDTHQLLTYEVSDYREPQLVVRKPNDTCPWK